VKEKLKVETFDITSAYINAKLPREKRHMMKIPKQIAELIVQVDPSAQEYVQKDGSILTEVLRALYGLPESAKLWNEHMSKILRDIGYTQSPSDPCLFKKIIGNEVSYITIYVDDCLHTYRGEKIRVELYKGIEENGLKDYKLQKLCRKVPISFLGMSISRCKDGSLFVSQPGYTQEILKEYDIRSEKKCPHTGDLYKVDTTSPLVDNTEYLSKLMKLFYLSNRTRPDIALACSALATRCKEPTEYDMSKVLHIYSYLNFTKYYGLTIDCNSMDIHAFFDAGWSVHPDAKSQSGMYFTLGYFGVPIFWKSIKQKMVGRSSTEAELICLFDGIDHLLWMKRVVIFFGYNQNIII
jgi:hypothetical protein